MINADYHMEGNGIDAIGGMMCLMWTRIFKLT